MPLTPEQVKELAHALHKAEHTLEPITPLTEQYPDMDIADAYAVQLEGIRERTEAHGGQIVGWKVGLTSKAMQQMLGVDQPDFGHLLDNTVAFPIVEVAGGRGGTRRRILPGGQPPFHVPGELLARRRTARDWTRSAASVTQPGQSLRYPATPARRADTARARKCWCSRGSSVSSG